MPLTATAQRACLCAVLLEEDASIIARFKDNEQQRPGHLFVNLLMALWIGSMAAGVRPCAHDAGQRDSMHKLCRRAQACCCNHLKCLSFQLGHGLCCLPLPASAQVISELGWQRKPTDLTGCAGGKKIYLNELMPPVIGIMQYISIELLFAKPMADWELVQDIIRPTFGALQPSALAMITCLTATAKQIF